MTATVLQCDREALKPCPFCGSVPLFAEAGGRWHVVCSNVECFCALGEGYDRDAMPDHAFVDSEEAVTAWNTRHDSTREMAEALEQRAAHAEHRYYGFRQWHAAKSAAVKKLIQDRAPDLWPDYAAVSVNGSIYSEGYTMQPTFEREMSILRHRAEAAEERATKAEITLATLQGTDR